MSYNETRVTIVGTVAGEVAHGLTSAGVSRAHFRMHTAERRWDGASEQFVDGNRMFIGVTCWRDLADGVHASLGKGDPVVVTGRMRVREADHEGTRRTYVEVDALAAGPNLRWCTATPHRGRAAPDGEDEPVAVAAHPPEEVAEPPF
ncbi:single-strand DNA-binding protein [Saccharothrix coeruleofusca]|uniref:single-stranded DNA-binding protein n=1 Tax=Saccharothrix coeruleofusca TaxID=33919 RepID=UPI001AE6B5FC|nr:single-stranded DNA-binding protein [Saccharothrix coeruleofusca]MBP2334129.1 single-strand DNA-binding protein [Saccharothrix coeruleofusca]